MEVLLLQNERTFNKLYLVGRGGYGKQLFNMLKTDKIISSAVFVDNKLKINLKKFYKLKKSINYNIPIGKPSVRENIFNILKKKKFFLFYIDIAKFKFIYK